MASFGMPGCIWRSLPRLTVCPAVLLSAGSVLQDLVDLLLGWSLEPGLQAKDRWVLHRGCPATLCRCLSRPGSAAAAFSLCAACWRTCLFLLTATPVCCCLLLVPQAANQQGPGCSEAQLACPTPAGDRCGRKAAGRPSPPAAAHASTACCPTVSCSASLSRGGDCKRGRCTGSRQSGCGGRSSSSSAAGGRPAARGAGKETACAAVLSRCHPQGHM